MSSAKTSSGGWSRRARIPRTVRPGRKCASESGIGVGDAPDSGSAPRRARHRRALRLVRAARRGSRRLLFVAPRHRAVAIDGESRCRLRCSICRQLVAKPDPPAQLAEIATSSFCAPWFESRRTHQQVAKSLVAESCPSTRPCEPQHLDQQQQRDPPDAPEASGKRELGERIWFLSTRAVAVRAVAGL